MALQVMEAFSCVSRCTKEEILQPSFCLGASELVEMVLPGSFRQVKRKKSSMSPQLCCPRCLLCSLSSQYRSWLGTCPHFFTTSCIKSFFTSLCGLLAFARYPVLLTSVVTLIARAHTHSLSQLTLKQVQPAALKPRV